MGCLCNQNSFFKENDAILYEQNYLKELQVDAYNWKTLYQCKFCKLFWEEHNQDDRFVPIPILEKVSSLYVDENWEK